MKDDTMTEQGARRLAAQIHDYWKKRGKFVRTWTVSTREHHGPLFAVRSDMVNGVPK